MKAKEAIRHISDHYKEGDEICLIIWSAPDVEVKAKEMGIEISPELAKQVLSTVERRHDASLGVSWDDFERVIEELVG